MKNTKRYSTTPRESVRVLANALIARDLTRREYGDLRNDALARGDFELYQALTFVLDATYDRVGVTR